MLQKRELERLGAKARLEGLFKEQQELLALYPELAQGKVWLDRVDAHPGKAKAAAPRRGRRVVSAITRKRMAESQAKRWEARKRINAATPPAPPQDDTTMPMTMADEAPPEQPVVEQPVAEQPVAEAPVAEATEEQAGQSRSRSRSRRRSAAA